MVNLLWPVSFSLLGGVASALLAGLFLGRNARPSAFWENAVLSFATGSMLGAAFVGMIPHAVEAIPGHRGFWVVLLAVLGFFVLEKLLVWRHCHEHGCGSHSQSAPLVLFGDAVHNFLDGAAIAVAFSESFTLGLATSLAVIAHEIPQEIGDVFILVNAGFAKGKAILANALGGLTTVLGAMAGLWFFGAMETLAPYALAVSGANFLYVALADLTPGHRQRPGAGATAVQFLCIGLGVAFIALVHRCPH